MKVEETNETPKDPASGTKIAENNKYSPSFSRTSNLTIRSYVAKDDQSSKVSTRNIVTRQPKRRESQVTSTTNVRKFKCSENGDIMINQYKVEKTLGEGSFAKVLLCKDTKTNI